MVLLSALFSAVFLSPFLFVMSTAAGIILWLARKRRAALVALSVTAAVMLALSTGAASMLLSRPLERRFPAALPTGFVPDVIVVLGGGAVDGAPDEAGAAGLSPASLKRVVRGYVLFRRTGAPLILSGGRTWDGERVEPEAEAAARTLASMGMPAAEVIKEGGSRTTWENAREVAKILAEGGQKRVALVTSAWHMPRAMLAFGKAGVECVPACTDYTFGERPLRARDFLPSFESLSSCFRDFREYIGIVQYAMRR
jgi:uncharacterized SAM-binding protein YcdF (DUF218 family)